MQVELSFLLLVYNVAPFIEACILSIVSQNLQSNYEIICIDDCSTDERLKELIRLKDYINDTDMLVPNVADYMLSHIKQSSCYLILGNYRSIPETFHFNELSECKQYYEVKCIDINNEKSSYLPANSMGIKMNAVWGDISPRIFN